MGTVAAFGFAWWLGPYLLARDVAKPTPRRPRVLGHALALATGPVSDAHPLLAAGHAVPLCLPAVRWTGVLLADLTTSGTIATLVLVGAIAGIAVLRLHAARR